MSLNFRGSFVFLLLLAAVSLGCGSMNRPVANPQPDSGPGPDQARIYFTLSQVFPGGQAFVLQRDELIGYVRNRQYFYVDVPAGPHLFMLVSENTEGLKGNFDGGKTYYVHLFVTPGFGSTRVYWKPMAPGEENWDKRHEWIDACTRMELIPEKASAWEEKYAEANANRLAKYESGEIEVAEMGPQNAE